MVKRKILSLRNFERVSPLFFAIIGIVTYIVIPKTDLILSLTKKFTSTDFLTIFITVEATLFGFLLTVLSIILQMNNKGIEKLKSINRFKELVSYGKSAVISSLILLILSIIIILIKDESQASKPLVIFNFLLGFMTIYNMVATIRFTNIFFVLSESGSS